MKKTLWIFLCTTILLNLLGCSSNLSSRNDPLPTNCPMPDYSAEENSIGNGSVFLFLIEGSQEYYVPNRDLIVDVLKEFTKNNLTLGDRIIIAWLDDSASTGMNRIVFVDAEGDLEDIEFPPIPTPRVVPTEKPVPIREATPFTQKGVEAATQDAESVKLENIKAQQEYSCLNYADFQEYLNDKAIVESKIKILENQFTNEINSRLDSSQLIKREEFPSYEEKRVPVLEALISVSGFLEEACTKDDNKQCYLIIFSTMKDDRRTWAVAPNEQQINFSNINSMVVLINCQYQDGDCGELAGAWSVRFQDVYQTSDIFFILDSIGSGEARVTSFSTRIEDYLMRDTE